MTLLRWLLLALAILVACFPGLFFRAVDYRGS